MHKIIIFDLGGVLFVHDNEGFNAWIKEKFSLDRNLGPLYKELRALRNCGKIDEHEYFNRFKDFAGIDITEKEYYDKYYKDHVKTSFDMINFIKDNLYGKYPLFCFSNNSVINIRNYKRYYDFETLFEKCIYSFELGVKKPDPEFFKKALKLMGHKGDDCVFFDDKLKSKESAEAEGIKFIQFKNLDTLKKDLKELGFL